VTTRPDLSDQPAEAARPKPADHEADHEAAEDAAQEADVEAAHSAAAKRIRRPRDMALSLAVLLVPILLIIGVGRFFYGDATTATVSPELALQGAARASMRPIPAATAPDGWKIVSAQFKDGVLRIGYLDRSEQGVQLVQGTALDLIDQELGDDAQPAGELMAGGETWAKWNARSGLSALTRKEGATTIIVQGQAPSAELATLADAVSTRSR
jgi:Protein of unknown function (DUF4245)